MPKESTKATKKAATGELGISFKSYPARTQTAFESCGCCVSPIIALDDAGLNGRAPFGAALITRLHSWNFVC